MKRLIKHDLLSWLKLGAFSAIVLLLLAKTPAQAVTFSEDTLIDAEDTTYDGQDIVVDCCTVTIQPNAKPTAIETPPPAIHTGMGLPDVLTEPR